MTDEADSPDGASLAAPDGDCCAVVLAVYRVIDAGRATEGIQHYAPDAILESAGGTAIGTAAIANVLASRQANTGRLTRHVLSEVAVSYPRMSRAIITATLSVFVLSGPTPSVPDAVSELRVELASHAGGWKILDHRSVRRTGVEPSGVET